MVARFAFEVLAYAASKKDFEIHDLSLELDLQRTTRYSIAAVVPLLISVCVPTRRHQHSHLQANIL